MNMNEIREKLLEMLTELHEDVDFENEKALVDGKVLDSFDLVSLAGQIGEEFDVEITAREFVADNFNSLDCMTEMVKRLMEE